jgi:hypothetical protein
VLYALANPVERAPSRVRAVSLRTHSPDSTACAAPLSVLVGWRHTAHAMTAVRTPSRFSSRAWRRRYREQLQAQTTSLIPVAVVDETPAQRVTTPSDARAVGNRTARAGTIEIRFGDVVVKVDGIVDADTLRVVLGSMRS